MSLTCWILTTEQQLTDQSTLCPAYHPGHQNLRQAEGKDAEVFRPPPALEPRDMVIHNKKDLSQLPSLRELPTFDPQDIIGKKFIKHHNGIPHKAEVLEPMEDGAKFLVALGDGDREEIMTYNDILNLVEEELDEDNEHVWSFEAVLGHRKHNGILEVKILWTNGDETWENLSHMGNQDPITLALYAKEKNLLGKPGWKRFKRMVGTEKHYISVLRKAQAVKKDAPKLKFGIEVPRNYKDVLRLDRLNGDKLAGSHHH